MKKWLIVSALVVAASSLFLFQSAKAQSLNPQTNRYESGLFVCQPSDYIKVSVVNLDPTNSHNYTVIVYEAAGSLSSVLNTGSTSISAATGTKAEYFLSSGASANDYAVEVTTDSGTVIPSVAVYTYSGGGYYAPRYWLAGSQLSKFKDHF